jgi:TM2 domain-containing membrane protein YozV
MESVGAILVLLYVTPGLIAYYRGHNSAAAILVLTLLLGWTGIVWIVALVWSLTGNVRREAAAPAVTQISVRQVVNVETDRRLAELARVVEEQNRRLETAIAPPAPALPASGEFAGLRPHVSRDGRAYYRNEIPDPPAGYPTLRGPALYEIPIEGCESRQDELQSIAGGKRDAPVHLRVNAFVYAEGDAVVVEIDGRRVGFVARDDSNFLAELHSISGPGAYACRALVEDGWPAWRVRLDAFRPLEARSA